MLTFDKYVVYLRSNNMGTTSKRKTDRRVEKTKQSLYNAFVSLIQNKTYTSITISELTKVANIDRRTFYLHYSCIDDVAKEMQAIARNMIVIKMQECNDYRIGTFIDCIAEVIDSKRDFYKVIFTDPSCAHFINDCVTSLKYCILETNKNSSLDQTKKEYYSEYIANGIIGSFAYWFRQDSPSVDLPKLTTLLKESMSESFKMIK